MLWFSPRIELLPLSGQVFPLTEAWENDPVDQAVTAGFELLISLYVLFGAWGVVLLSSVLFGLAHLYQGRGGLLSTLVIGTVFGTARIAYDGMVPVMVWHFVVDAVAGIAGPKYLLKQVPPTREEISTIQ